VLLEGNLNGASARGPAGEPERVRGARGTGKARGRGRIRVSSPPSESPGPNLKLKPVPLPRSDPGSIRVPGFEHRSKSRHRGSRHPSPRAGRARARSKPRGIKCAGIGPSATEFESESESAPVFKCFMPAIRVPGAGRAATLLAFRPPARSGSGPLLAQLARLELRGRFSGRALRLDRRAGRARLRPGRPGRRTSPARLDPRRRCLQCGGVAPDSAAVRCATARLRATARRAPPAPRLRSPQPPSEQSLAAAAVWRRGLGGP
jgi:hypothetical protein